MNSIRDRKLDDLNSEFRLIIFQFLARLIEARIMIMIVETLRTEEQHQEDLKNGHSWILHSKHQDGLAIDICPFSIYQLHGDDKLQWNVNDPVWYTIGAIGEQLELKWGGRWPKRDMGHFEIG